MLQKWEGHGEVAYGKRKSVYAKRKSDEMIKAALNEQLLNKMYS